MRTLLAVVVLMFSISTARAELRSYIISSNNPMFCEGGRFLLAGRKNGLYLKCENPTATILSIETSGSTIKGVHITSERLEDVAARLSK